MCPPNAKMHSSSGLHQANCYRQTMAQPELPSGRFQAWLARSSDSREPDGERCIPNRS